MYTYVQFAHINGFKELSEEMQMTAKKWVKIFWKRNTMKV